MQDLVKTIEVEINSQCNLACRYCPNSSSERIEQGDMDPQLFQLLLNQLKAMEYQGRFNYHFYNEPLLSPNLLHFIKLANSHLPNCLHTIYSNGTLLTMSKLIELISIGVDKFIITKHHPVQKIPLEDFYQELPQKYKAKVIFKQYQQLKMTNRGGLIPNEKPQKPLPLQRPCFIPATTAIITVQGNVVGCYEDYKQKHIFGNISETPFLEIWNSPIYRTFRDDLKKGRRSQYEVCSQCDSTLVLP